MRCSALTLVALAVLGATPAAAAVVRECDQTASAGMIVEPWEANSRTFYKGQVRLAWVDTGGEPVCCSSHLVVIFPDPRDETGGRACRLVSKTADAGFQGVDMKAIKTSYEPAKGLGLAVPVTVPAPGGEGTLKATLNLRLNLSIGALTVER
jgi:hypothetical protein